MIAIIQYNAGNIGSVQNALQRLGADCEVTNDPQRILSADKVIFPGVGEASSAMESLRQSGLVDVITNLQQPVLGICLGLQLMCTSSEENDTTCLGIFDAAVKLFPPTDIIPHMGWNNCQNLSSKIFDGLTDADNFYFVHSYYAEVAAGCVATGNYILPFSAALNKNNFYATQFHPEKSASAGEKLLQNFLAL